MKHLVLILLFCNLTFSQVKDISKLTLTQKKQELIETLYWIQSKTGKDFNFYNVVDKKKRYCYLEFDIDNPKEIVISYYDFDTDIEHKRYNFNLNDISTVSKSETNNNSSVFLFTYSDQRLISEVDEGKNYKVHYVTLPFDNLVKTERMENAWKYAIKLAGEKTNRIKEKF